MEEEEEDVTVQSRARQEIISASSRSTSSTERGETEAATLTSTISVQSSSQASIRQHGVIITQQQPSDDDSDTVGNASDADEGAAALPEFEPDTDVASFLGARQSRTTSTKSSLYSSKSTENVVSWKTSTQLTSSSKSFLMSHAKSEETSPNASPTRAPGGAYKPGGGTIYSARSTENVASWKETQQLQQLAVRSSSSKGSSLSSQEEASPPRGLTQAHSVETSSVGQEGRQWLSAAASRAELARSMESLRTAVTQQQSGKLQAHHHHRQSFLTSSERDMRRVVATSVEARSLESLEREIRLKRRAVSGEEPPSASGGEEPLSAERRRGLYAVGGERRAAVPSHLSLLTTPVPQDRRLTILSPHSPMAPPDLLQLASLKNRRKKAVVLPKLILPRSESDVFME
ncbi:uncharacterized protein LOC126471229 [Schistocerca serialis cubense]|uniref:uncharacterized protein LOC126471229 n=1 Tax=Schistocerca serialis cubense TaxID=2023355 RepID=UPI00214F0F8B|nr:uncharacterized protein LOC126471229 [Schistocerca serialis cubense]